MGSADRREEILLVIQALLKAIPSVGGRVYAKMRGSAKPDESELPALELVTSAKTPDAPVPLDDHLYVDELHVEIAGYAKSDDAGDDLDGPVRAALNALRADVIQAMSGLDTFGTAPLRRRFGRVTPLLTSEWTEPSTETPDGYLVLEYSVRFMFDERNP